MLIKGKEKKKTINTLGTLFRVVTQYPTTSLINDVKNSMEVIPDDLTKANK